MKTKKNISILSIDYGAGGTERVISLLLQHLVNDYNVTLVLFYNYIDYEIPDGVELEILSSSMSRENTLFRKAKDTLAVTFKYHRLIRRKKIDVSLAFLALPNIINGIMAMWNKDLRTIISERCYPSIMYKANISSRLLANYMFPYFYSKNDHLFSNSIHINKDLKDHFNVNMPMSVIYNPISVDENLRKLPEEIVTTKIFRFINVGSLYHAKNQMMIIKTLPLLEKNNFQFEHAGVGEMESEIRKSLKELEVEEQVTFLGKISHVRQALIKNDCFVLSSRTEGFPNVVLEAMSVGLPVIATNCMSGPLELLNDNEPVNIKDGEFVQCKYGILINVDDTIALAKALTYLKAHPVVRQKYSLAGFERAKRNDLKIIYNQVTELIEG
ncbi:N-acetylgalactosamine-N,N'-diacetylbacillosaminyl-diphospho-undecaprenol 4-alpha-N-acetylgalactosaminyltransferase [Gelidibacter sediminis]|uniref:N-acetylgalactosamine-N, N'-diacetylbacillosaminyl-diphospho-undecaprenol 4-alpha-N-acetylgalactosaminyltransferase n=1 Tax=Gelidibacter sediminis TaxID=1608710 RepID=A0A4R7PYD4_9FLAO|nr:glycosyltransferase [Gelidibacter sediminis]TDU40007.1 N-acetylgalactosamine-N,N'-diacetylbacillosaminyl-diphospho-undecaprenol 4-alpha-N-acetylgalactosaminyltransferase [Gelidibacter sediminis]